MPEATHEPDDDLSLVLRSRDGDRAAFEQLVRRTGRLLYAHLLPKTAGDVHRAEDLVQDTYLTAWRTIRALHEPRSFRPWLITIANTTLIDRARRESRKKRRSPASRIGPNEPLEGIASSDPSPDATSETNDERRRVLSVLESLPEEYRVPLSLRYLGGADYDQISRQLALSNGSLRGLLQRGMKMLREKLNA